MQIGAGPRGQYLTRSVQYRTGGGITAKLHSTKIDTLIQLGDTANTPR